MDILVNVANQKLKISTNLKSLVAGTQEFIRFVFNLSGDWDGLTTFAQFSQNGVSYNQYLDEDNSVYLPSEIGVGTCTLMLYGSNDNVRATTNYVTLTIDKNTLVADASSTEISQTLYDQLVSRINQDEITLSSAVDAANDKAIEALAATTKSEGAFTPNFTMQNGSKLTVTQIGNVVYISGMVTISSGTFADVSGNHFGDITGVTVPTGVVFLPVLTTLDSETFHPGIFAVVGIGNNSVYIGMGIDESDNCLIVNTFYLI